MKHPLRLQLSGQAGSMDNYCQALSQLGACSFAGYAPEPDLSCDGLVLCGGGDLESTLFGQEDRGSNPPDRVRDRAELRLFDAFFRARKPILGICRGMQVINVALGGDIIQDLPPEVRPFHVPRGEEDQVHPIRASEDSILSALYGPVFPVNSWHHQAVGRLGEGLRAIAWAEGGFAEALEHRDRPVLGVQFHPERLALCRRPDRVDGALLLSYFLSLISG